MARCGPFEPRPWLAVGLSGGPDSMALCLLADAWARARGGRLTALTVDHGLRPASASEAQAVAGWARRRGVEHQVLTWRRAARDGAGQQAARLARYRLLMTYCRDQGVLHLLVGHHARDQLETVLMRLVRGSGADGLAGMRLVVPTLHGRIVRPLLEFPPERLRASLEASKESWIEDPSNLDQRYARARIRLALPSLEVTAGGAEWWMRRVRTLRQARDRMDDAVNALLGRILRWHPSGACWLAGAELAAAPQAIALRAVAQAIAVTGGACWPPRLPRVEQALRRLDDPVGGVTTLGRCRIERTARHLFLCREARGLPEPMGLVQAERGLWDHRFAVRCEGANRADFAYWLRPVGREGARALLAAAAPLNRKLPIASWPALPAIGDRQGIVLVPYLAYRRPDVEALPLRLDLRFFPRLAMAAGPRTFLV